MNKIKDKRKYPRFQVHYDVVCEGPNGQTEKKVYAVCENVSRIGMKLSFQGDLPKDSLIKFEILKSPDTDFITCYGKVVWEKDSSLVYGETNAGVHITKMRWTETEKLIA